MVVGAGAIGGFLAARLHEAGVNTVLVARGQALEAISRGGVVIAQGSSRVPVPVPVVGTPGELRFAGNETVVLATKSQDTAEALATVFATAPAGCTVVCAQNGVANERQALRYTGNVIGMLVLCPSALLEPGVIQPPDGELGGVLDVGAITEAAAGEADTLAGRLRAAGFASENRPDILRWKYRKLIANLGNVVEALCGLGARGGELASLAAAEARACYAAAGIEATNDAEYTSRTGLVPMSTGRGGSTWQSRTRGATSWETPYLNGEITMLGHLHGVPVPVNELLVKAAGQVAASGGTAPLLDEAALLARVS